MGTAVRGRPGGSRCDPALPASPKSAPIRTALGASPAVGVRVAVLAFAIVGLGALVGFCIAPSVAVAQPTSPAPRRARVRAMLSGYEWVPGAEQWRALGPGTAGMLIALYDDASEPPYVRLRAVAAVAHFPSAATRTFLGAVSRAPGQSDLFVREALLALATAFGDRARGDIAAFMADPRPVVRQGAAIGLGRVGTAAAREILRRRSLVEGDIAVRETLRRALSMPAPTPGN